MDTFFQFDCLLASPGACSFEYQLDNYHVWMPSLAVLELHQMVQGPHTIRVRAVSSATKLVDPAPLNYSWQVSPCALRGSRC
jgi:hypothetical protein